VKIYQLPGGILIGTGEQFQIGNQKYPAGWVGLASDAELAAAGITVIIIADPPPPPPPPPEQTGPQAVTGSYVASLRRRAMQLRDKGDIAGSIDLLLKASAAEPRT
jgi:hypothetical protein